MSDRGSPANPRFDAVRFTTVPSPAPGDGVRLPEDARWHVDVQTALIGLPQGDAALRGVPFALTPGNADGPEVWVGPGRPLVRFELPSARPIGRLLVAHGSVPSPDGRLANGAPSLKVAHPGERIGEYVVEYADGTETRHPVRRRFEVNDIIVDWGEPAFAAVPHQTPETRSWQGPHAPGEWGGDQTGLGQHPFASSYAIGTTQAVITSTYWLWSIGSPLADGRPVAVRVEGGDTGFLIVGGLTVGHLRSDPFHWGRRRSIRLRTIADGSSAGTIAVDLGIVAGTEPLPASYPDTWVEDPVRGLGSPVPEVQERLDTLIHVTAAEAATLHVGDHSVDMTALESGSPWHSDDGSVRIEALPPSSVLTRVAIIEGDSGRVTPARVHVRAADGRYLPPQGHRREVNTNWFQDYGADVQLGGTPYAYVDGQFEIYLPPGEAFVEVVKGFEFRPERQRILVDGQTAEVTVTLERATDWRRKGWVTADTHVHFLSPQTAHLEAQAEGVNIVNLLIAQWGEMYTNVGDYTGAASGTSANDTIVWVGSENRQHVLGHLNLLGMTGSPVWPLSAAGPTESGLGDPTWTTLADWADACRARDGVVVAPHFPNPFAEIVADVITGRIDAVELREFPHGIESTSLREWYRLLNCGFRVAAVGGTDKMDAGMPVGGVRTYARIGDGPLTYGAWAEAVRAGRTFTTSGPLIDLTVDGHELGSEIVIPTTGAILDVRAQVASIYPISEIEIVVNGRVIERSTPDATGTFTLDARVRVDQAGWIAARCIGPSIAWHGWPIRTAAHTSPIYVSGPALRRPHHDVAFLAAVIDGGLTWLDTLAIVPDPSTAKRLRRVFEDAKRILA